MLRLFEERPLTYQVAIATLVCEVRSRLSFNTLGDWALEDRIAMLVNNAHFT
jgi:hypothetical protein